MGYLLHSPYSNLRTKFLDLGYQGLIILFQCGKDDIETLTSRCGARQYIEESVIPSYGHACIVLMISGEQKSYSLAK